MTHSPGSGQGDDAQRDMEQRALRNVRGLLDKLEDKDQLDRRALKRQVVAIVAVIVAVCAMAWLATTLFVKEQAPRSVVIPPPASAPR